MQNQGLVTKPDYGGAGVPAAVARNRVWWRPHPDDTGLLSLAEAACEGRSRPEQEPTQGLICTPKDLHVQPLKVDVQIPQVTCPGEPLTPEPGARGLACSQHRGKWRLCLSAFIHPFVHSSGKGVSSASDRQALSQVALPLCCPVLCVSKVSQLSHCPWPAHGHCQGLGWGRGCGSGSDGR